jgi:hypothetical protein
VAFDSRIFTFLNLYVYELVRREVFEMPIDWKKPEAAFRLLAAVYGALGEEPVRYRSRGPFLLFSRTTSGIFRTVSKRVRMRAVLMKIVQG